jgi:hypothetical protein
MKLAPNSVSGRVVKISMPSSKLAGASPSHSNRICKPSDRPIQFACMVRTFSGQRSSF